MAPRTSIHWPVRRRRKTHLYSAENQGPAAKISPDRMWSVSAAEYFYFAQHAKTIEPIGIYTAPTVTMLVDGVADRVQFHERDMFATDVGEATVVTIYLLPSIMGKVEQKLRAELKPGARIVVHGAALMRARHRSARSVR